MYAYVTPTGVVSFRYDYRIQLDGVSKAKAKTLVIGRYDRERGGSEERKLAELSYGLDLSLAEARTLLGEARRAVKAGQSPADEKSEERAEAANAGTFDGWATRYFEFKADSKSGEEQLADSTLDLRRSVYRRLLQPALGDKPLEAIRRTELADLFDSIKAKNGPGPAVHARELVLLIFRYAAGKGVEGLANPAEAIPRNTIATFKARERNLDRHEIKAFLEALEGGHTHDAHVAAGASIRAADNGAKGRIHRRHLEGDRLGPRPVDYPGVEDEGRQGACCAAVGPGAGHPDDA